MKSLLAIGVLLVTGIGCAPSSAPAAPTNSATGAPRYEGDTVVHPAPTDPIYVSVETYDVFRRALPPLPTKESSAQKADEDELRSLQQRRTTQECERAKGEVHVSLETFFGKAAGGPLDAAQVERLSPFFELIKNEGDYFVQRLKVDVVRPRPFTYITGLTPCVPREVTNAYPSGHAALAKLFALVLADLVPEHRDAFERRAEEIATHRVLVGMHHRSDVEAGRRLATGIYEALQQSERYKRELAQVRDGATK